MNYKRYNNVHRNNIISLLLNMKSDINNENWGCMYNVSKTVKISCNIWKCTSEYKFDRIYIWFIFSFCACKLLTCDIFGTYCSLCLTEMKFNKKAGYHGLFKKTYLTRQMSLNFPKSWYWNKFHFKLNCSYKK